MKLTYKQLTASLGNPAEGDPGAFPRFRAEQKPLKTAIAMKAINRAVIQHAADYDEFRLEICKRHGHINENTNCYEFGDNRPAFDKEFGELLDSEISIAGPRIKISQLLSSMSISDDDLTTLEWLIDDGTPEAAPKSEDEHDIEECDGQDAEGNDLLDLDEKSSSATA